MAGMPLLSRIGPGCDCEVQILLFIFGRKKCFMIIFLLKYSFAHFATAVISGILTHTPRNVNIDVKCGSLIIDTAP